MTDREQRHRLRSSALLHKTTNIRQRYNSLQELLRGWIVSTALQINTISKGSKMSFLGLKCICNMFTNIYLYNIGLSIAFQGICASVLVVRSTIRIAHCEDHYISKHKLVMSKCSYQ